MRLQQIAACCVLALTAAGQGSRGSISGTLKDSDGAPVPNAQVQAKNKDGAQFETKAAASGAYSIRNLPAGKYDLTILASGMMPFMKADVAVAAGASVRLDAVLEDPSLKTVGEDRIFFANAFDPHNAPIGPVPRTADGKPDFSGLWNALRIVDPGKPEALPWAEALVKERAANNQKDLPTARCLPAGLALDGIFGVFRIMQNKTVLAFIWEDDLPRQVYLDGRKHPDESLSPFIGHSVGHWEGDTLVIDVTGFNDKNWLDMDGHPQTEKLHVTERITRKDYGHLEDELTIDDPGAYKKPWTIRKASELAPEDKEEVGQYVCTENNRDVPHLVGK